MLKINNTKILDRATSHNTYLKGKAYYNNNKVLNIRTNKGKNIFFADVKGSCMYDVSASFDNKGELRSTDCTCPAYNEYPGDCKHIVALLLLINDLDKTGRLSFEPSVGKIENILDNYRKVNNTNKTIANLEVTFGYDDNLPHITFRIGEGKYYIVKNMSNFLSSISDEEEIEFGKFFTFNPNTHKFSPEDQRLIDYLILLHENYELNKNYGGRWNTTFEDKKMYLGPKSLEKFFDLMLGRRMNIDITGLELKNVLITDEPLEIKIGIIKNEDHLTLFLDNNAKAMKMTNNGRFMLYGDKIYKLPTEQANALMPIYDEIIDKDLQRIKINENLKESFVSEVLPNIKKHLSVHLDKSVEESIYSPPLSAQIFFDRQDEKVIGRAIFNYGDIEINPFSSKDDKRDSNKILLRDMEKENIILNLMEQGDFKVNSGLFYLDEEEKIYDFLSDIMPRLQELSEIYYSESFRKLRLIEKEKFSGSVRLNTEVDMLEFNFNIEGIELDELEKVFFAVKEKKKYYRLKNGSFISLDNEDFDNIVQMIDYLNISEKEIINGNFMIPKYRTMFLDNFMRDRKLDYINKNVDFKKMVRDIKEPEDFDYELPKGVNADLRNYQEFGFKWLKTLTRYNLGGILADDMGLGKTLQMLTFLLSEKDEKGSEPNLIIVPTSLIYNWEDEAKKFTKDLKSILIVGSKEERIELIKESTNYDLVITSYPLVRRDMEYYKDIQFRYCILDEAQHIKNFNSLNSKSVKTINAKNRFALTGTPMENSLSELWSIFDFLMPGYLLTNSKFINKFEKSIVKDQDNLKLKDLNNHIRPFILRRMKKEVLKELPDKIEQKIVVDMTVEQKKLYLAYLQAIKGELNEEINSKGYNKSHIKILAGLTRLRQLCCHPGLFIEDYKGDSGKLEILEELLDEAMDNGRRVLIFSQFTSMLEKIRGMLIRKNIGFKYLDGSTPTIERGELVRDFNNGEGDIFLISLKAGGTGLNLTSADMVIHFDPWWNPAVEDQATDRAHRIGQKNIVQVIKLITKGTIEEKIFELQEKKKEMIDKVIREGETLITKLSEEEIMSLFEV